MRKETSRVHQALRIIRKLLCLGVVALLLPAGLTGCSGSTAPKEIGKADNEILTYQKLDPKKTTLTLSRTGNIYIDALSRAFEEKNPDVQIVCLDITGGNHASLPAADWLTHQLTPDIMITTAELLPSEITAQYCMDLSTSDLLDSYEHAALTNTAVDGKIYRLPGPSDISCMIYNKTLFEQYGWKVPTTFDEFIAVCRQIREDTNGTVQPWNPNAKYSNELMTALEAFTYADLFGGADNRVWYDSYMEGKATFAGHMEPFYEMLQKLIDNDLLKEEHFTYSATTRGNEFKNGQIAMLNYLVSDFNSEQYEFSFMPFPSTTGDMGYVYANYSCYVCVPIKERTKSVTDAMNRFLRYLSTPEGQQVFIGKSIKISNVINTPMNTNADLSPLQSVVEKGHIFTNLYFSYASQGRSSLYTQAHQLLTGERTAEACIAEMDAALPEVTTTAEPNEAVAAAASDFTILETSCYIADMYREAANADIGLIANLEAFRGNLMRIFAGELSKDHIITLKPRSFGNGSKLVKVSMTGRQLIEALNHPTGNKNPSDCVYAFSGLQCEIAPWRPLGEKLLSVKLADGTALDMDKRYTVAIWEGTVEEEYITEVLEAYDGTWEEWMTAKLKKDGTIAPAKDSRIKLVWD